MKQITRSLGFVIILVGFSLPVFAVESPSPHDDWEHEMFYEDLMPYGEWISFGPGVTVWRPIRVDHHWRPYSDGRWVWTRHGWYWVSSEPFGWAVFHYGRWAYSDRYGWVWYPGRVWGPAWVEWRYSNMYIGWAPLPPTAIFHASFGIRYTRSWVAPHSYWCFVDYKSFGHASQHRAYVPTERVRRILGTTRRGSSYAVGREGAVNRGIDRDLVERRSGSRVERLEVRSGTRTGREEIRSGAVESYRPDRGQGNRDRVTRPDVRMNRETPASRDSKIRNNRPQEYTRPEGNRSTKERESYRPAPADRRVAPSVRPGQRQEGTDKRSEDKHPARKRDN